MIIENNIYEDYWKNSKSDKYFNQTSLNIKVKNNNNFKDFSNFEKTLDQVDLIYNFTIYKFDKDFTF